MVVFELLGTEVFGVTETIVEVGLPVDVWILVMTPDELPVDVWILVMAPDELPADVWILVMAPDELPADVWALVMAPDEVNWADVLEQLDWIDI